MLEPEPPFNVNLIAADVIDRQLNHSYDRIGSTIGKAAAHVRTWFKQSFKEYLNRTSERVGRTRTLLSGDHEICIQEFFVPPQLVHGRKDLEGSSLASLFELGPRLQLVGTGGSGKSVLMRYFFLVAMAEFKAIPVFVELRKLDHSEPQSVYRAIIDTLSINGKKDASLVTAALLETGSILLLLDGLDEVAVAHKDSVEQEIQRIAMKNPRLHLVVSSRPSDTLGAWPGFEVVRPAPPSLEMIKKIVGKLDYDKTLSELFIDELSTGMLANSYQEIINTPLMVVILLLTFQDTAGLPEKQYLLYDHAYDALARRHDATKTGYKRENHTGLPADDFHRLTGATSFVLYIKERFVFTRSDFGAALSHASDLCGVTVESRDFLNDLTSSVCLVIQDGLQYTFVHRSFQEFFAASFVRAAQPAAQKKLIAAITHRVTQDQVMRMLWEMDHTLVESTVILPWLTEFKAVIDKCQSPAEQYRTYLDYIGLYIGKMRPSQELIESDDPFDACMLMIDPSEYSGSSGRERRTDICWFILHQYVNKPSRDRTIPISPVELAKFCRKNAAIASIPEDDFTGASIMPFSKLILSDQDVDYMNSAGWEIAPQAVENLLSLLSELTRGNARRQKAYEDLFGLPPEEA